MTNQHEPVSPRADTISGGGAAAGAMAVPSKDTSSQQAAPANGHVASNGNGHAHRGLMAISGVASGQSSPMVAGTDSVIGPAMVDPVDTTKAHLRVIAKGGPDVPPDLYPWPLSILVSGTAWTLPPRVSCRRCCMCRCQLLTHARNTYPLLQPNGFDPCAEMMNTLLSVGSGSLSQCFPILPLITAPR